MHENVTRAVRVVAALSAMVTFLADPSALPRLSVREARAAPGVLAAYDFDAGSGTTLADSSGNGFDGTLRNGPVWTTGKNGGGLAFDGVNDFVDLGNPAPLRLTGSMTVSAWVYETANVTDDGQIVAKSDGSSGWQLKSSPDTGVRTFAIAVTSSGRALAQRYSRTVRALKTWYHVTGVYDATARALHIYVNGVLDDGVLSGTVPAAQRDSSVDANIGRRTGGFYLRGVVDDVRIYSRVLTPAEIQSDMATPVGGSSGSGDTTPPAVSLTAPTSGGTVSGTTTVSASASDNVGVVGVQFLLDGAPLGAEDTAAPYSVSWDTTTVGNGAHVLAARARDAAGNSTTSTGVTVTVSNPVPAGTVTINGGAAATNSTSVTLTLSAGGTVTQMRFSNDGSNFSAVEPFATTRSWSLAAGDGTKTVFAQFGDAAGAWSASATDTIVLDTIPPTISAVAATSVTGVSAHITWTTSEPATSQVEYGLATSYGSSTPVDTGLVTAHDVTVSNLAPGTQYDYRVRSKDAAGNEAVSANGTFTTATASDVTPPSVPTNLSAQVSANQVVLSWAASTDDVGVAGYKVFRNATQIATVSSGTSYLDGSVAPSTTYGYAVSAFDAAGNQSAQSATLGVTTPPASGTGATPTLVQHASSSYNPPGQGIAGNDYRFSLPNAVGAGNALVLGISWAAARTVTSISDTVNGTWCSGNCLASAAVSAGSADTRSAIFVHPGSGAGVTRITVSFDASFEPFQYTLSEFFNVATSSPVSGTSASSTAAGPSSSGGTATVASGSFTPGNNDANGGNLIWTYAFDNVAVPGWKGTQFTAGAGATLLDADIAWVIAHGAQYQVQPTAGAITPAISVKMTGSGGADRFNVLSVALKAAAAGTAPPAGIRIVHVSHFTNETYPSSWDMQFPSSGNLVVISTNEPSPVIAISSVTDNHGNSWSKINPDPGEAQMWFAASATTGQDLRYTIHDTFGAGASVVAYDITGADPSPLGEVAGTPYTGIGSASFVTDSPIITPSTPGVTLATACFGQGPSDGPFSGAPPGAVFDLVSYSGETDLDTMENADAKGHVYVNAASGNIGVTQHWNWSLPRAVGNNAVDALAAHFKEAGH